MKKLFPARLAALLLALLLTAGLAPAPAAAAGTAHFADVPAGHWAYSYVEQAYEDGAFAGTGGDPAKGTGVFDPDRQMTFGEFFTMLASAFYPDEMGWVSKDGAWYAPAIRVALNHGLTYLDADDLMNTRAGKPISRFHASYAVVKLLQDRGVPLPSQKEREAAAAQIADWSAMSESTWSYYAASVYALGVMTGVDGQGTFDGSGTITRASAAVIYTKTADKLGVKKDFFITFNENWDLITVPGYTELMEAVFLETYPRLMARWGDEGTQKTVPVGAYTPEEDPGYIMVSLWNYNGTGLRYIMVSAALQEEYPASHSTAHELVHVVASYTTLKSSWWRECIADYGRFRYYKWTSQDHLDGYNYFQLEDGRQTDWNFTAYGGQWFFAWMDYRYPTTPKGLGLIDAIHTAIRAGQITSDDVNDPKFNAVVQQITGYSTITQLHQQYLKELNSGAWVFRGFADYQDNYITENLPGVPNPSYPTGEGYNLALHARVYRRSGETANGPAENLLDGDRTTKWQAGREDVGGTSVRSDVQHAVGIDLGQNMTFNAYTLYHEGSQGNSSQNTAAWRLYYFDSQKNDWVQFDEIRGNTGNVTSRTVKPVTTQYVWLDVLESSGNGDGAVRLYELELYYNE